MRSGRQPVARTRRGSTSPRAREDAGPLGSYDLYRHGAAGFPQSRGSRTSGCQSFRGVLPLQYMSRLPVIAWTWPSHSKLNASQPSRTARRHFSCVASSRAYSRTIAIWRSPCPVSCSARSSYVAAAELLHEVLHHDVHERVVPFARDVRNDVAEEDGVRPHPQVVLDLTEDDLLARPAMLDDALEPRMVRHEESVRDVPQLRDERVRLLCDHVATVGVLARRTVR